MIVSMKYFAVPATLADDTDSDWCDSEDYDDVYEVMER